jgi:acyl-CoA dehydrogenase
MHGDLLMMTLIVVAGALVVAWLLAYLGAPLWVWTTGAALGTAALLATQAIGVAATVILGVVLAVMLLLNIVPLRRALLTRPIFGVFKKVLPEMSSTEREAIEAGESWWEAELFQGRPKWNRLLDFNYTELTSEERSFLSNECEEVCKLVDDWKTEFEDKDLSPAVWKYIREKRFLAMLIGREFGGLGFSARAQSEVVTKLATKSIALAVTVMVPNSLGPGELLVKYGTDAQRKQWLPGLIDGSEIPCFGLTGPEVGSDATAMPDTGVVEVGEHEGKPTLGLRLNFSKRWITLAPVATVVGLAFKLKDPQGLLREYLRKNAVADVAKDGLEQGPKDGEYGITCALIPAKHPGVSIGRRHYPGSAFMNGPIFGHDVFIPIDWIIGGPKMAGHGWRMLVECLSAGRGISLPALATAAGQASYRMTGAYSRIRRQFKVAVGKFEGVQEATGRIAGYTYTLEAMRLLSASAVDHCTPSVVTGIAKYHMTEIMRKVLIDAMDVFSGRGIQQGPRNPLAQAYKSVPIAITVEGANILTRNLMIFGQGAIRSHAYVLDEMEAARTGDVKKFDRLLFAHLGSAVNRAVRAFTHGLTGAVFARSPKAGITAPYFKKMEHLSASLSFLADMTMGVLGGELKRKERLSARLGDVLSQLYIASSVLRFYIANGERENEASHLRWAMDNALAEAGKALEEFLRNFPVRPVAWLMRLVTLPLGNPYQPVADKLNGEVAEQMLEPGDLRDRLSHLVFRNGGKNDPISILEHAFDLLIDAEEPYVKYFKAAAKNQLDGEHIADKLRDAVKKNIITAEEAKRVEEYDAARFDAILTDDFSKEYLTGDFSPEQRAEIIEFSAHQRVA